MTWVKRKLDAGTLRSADLYSDITQRSDHIMSNYRPILGGVSPLSYKGTASGTLQLFINTVLSPCSCAFELHIVYKVTGAGANGTISFDYDGSSYSTASLASTTPAIATITGATGTGDPEKAAIKCSAQSGSIEVYGGYFVPAANDANGITELPPDPDALASGMPIGTDAIRRLIAAPRYILDSRRAALAYFSHELMRDGTDTIEIAPQIDLSRSFRVTSYDTTPSFKMSFLATSGTSGSLYGDGGSSTVSSSSATTLYTTSAVTTTEHLSFMFSGPVESYVVYEV